MGRWRLVWRFCLPLPKFAETPLIDTFLLGLEKPSSAQVYVSKMEKIKPFFGASHVKLFNEYSEEKNVQAGLLIK